MIGPKGLQAVFRYLERQRNGKISENVPKADIEEEIALNKRVDRLWTHFCGNDRSSKSLSFAQVEEFVIALFCDNGSSCDDVRIRQLLFVISYKSEGLFTKNQIKELLQAIDYVANKVKENGADGQRRKKTEIKQRKKTVQRNPENDGAVEQ